MAEFGENVRRLREAKGMTQQTLADELYVTRQAVSRWEGGSRYPDLMTAKKLAGALGSTMDALLADDDMRQYPEKAPVLESPLERGAQTAVLAFGFAIHLTLLLWYGIGIVELFSQAMDPLASVIAIGRVLMALLFGYGTLASVRERLTPGVAVMIAVLQFGASALTRVFSALAFRSVEAGSAFQLGIAVVVAACGVICAWYIGWGGTRSPLPIYMICGASAVLRVASAIYAIAMSRDNEFFGAIYSNTVASALTELASLGLLCVMARTLYGKRMRAGRDNQH